MAKTIQNKLTALRSEYNCLLMDLEEMEERAPYKGWKDKDGYMDYLENELTEIKAEIERLSNYSGEPTETLIATPAGRKCRERLQ